MNLPQGGLPGQVLTLVATNELGWTTPGAGGGDLSLDVFSSGAGKTGSVFNLGQMGTGTSIVTLPGTSGTPTFSPSDIGKAIQVTGAGVGGADLYTTIQSLNSPTSANLAAVASTTSNRASVFWYPVGQDDTAAIQAAIDSCTENLGTVTLSAGLFVISSTITDSPLWLALQGQGRNQTALVVSSAAFAGDGIDVDSNKQAFSISGLTLKGPGLSVASSTAVVTAFSVTSNVATFTSNNPFQAGQPICLAGFQNSGSFANDVFAAVLSTGLSGTQFEVDLVPGPLTGSTASLNTTGTTVTMTGGTNFTPNLAFLDITISNADAGNIGTFVMTPWISATSFQWQNVSAPAGADSHNGAIDWAVSGTGTDTGVAHLDYNGLSFTFGQESTNTLNYVRVSDVRSMRWPGDGFKCASAIVSKFDHCISLLNNGNGFAVYYVLQVGSTSIDFNTCYANANQQAGYYTHTTAYDSYQSCAADSNGISYYLFTARSAGLLGCGSEATLYQNAAYPGYHYYIHGGQGCGLIACYGSANSGVSNPSGTYLVLDNQASNHFIQGMTFNGRIGFLPTQPYNIHFSCFDNTIWEPFFSNNLASAGVDSGANDTIYVAGVLPAANQAPQTLIGDSGGTTAANVVNKITGGVAAGVPVTHPLAVGVTPALALGTLVRGPSGTQTLIAVRNASNTGDIAMLGCTSGGSAVIGDGTNGVNCNLSVPVGGLVQCQGGGNNALQIACNPTGATSAKAASTVTSLLFGILTAAGPGTGAFCGIQGQSMTSGTGGLCTLGGGTGSVAYGQTLVESSLNLGAQSFIMTSLTVTLTPAQSAAGIIIVTGTITGTPSLVFAESPTLGLFKLVRNNGSGTIAVQWASGTSINVASGTAALIGSDGTNAILLLAGS